MSGGPLTPRGHQLRIALPGGQELRWHRERLELSSSDAQQLVVLLPADEATAATVERLRHGRRGPLRAIG